MTLNCLGRAVRYPPVPGRPPSGGRLGSSAGPSLRGRAGWSQPAVATSARLRFPFPFSFAYRPLGPFRGLWRLLHGEGGPAPFLIDLNKGKPVDVVTRDDDIEFPLTQEGGQSDDDEQYSVQKRNQYLCAEGLARDDEYPLLSKLGISRRIRT